MESQVSGDLFRCVKDDWKSEVEEGVEYSALVAQVPPAPFVRPFPERVMLIRRAVPGDSEAPRFICAVPLLEVRRALGWSGWG